MDSEKGINVFKLEKRDMSRNYLLDKFFWNQFVNNFLVSLLCKINVLDIFDMDDFFSIFIILWSTEILIEWNFWVIMYVPYILGCMTHTMESLFSSSHLHFQPKVPIDRNFSTLPNNNFFCSHLFWIIIVPNC